MSLYQQLKAQAAEVRQMAEQLTKAASAIESAEKAKKELEGKLKIAEACSVKKASATAQLGALAKNASAMLLQAGVLRSQKQADDVAALLMDHGQAIHKVAQLAKICENIPRTAQVVRDNTPVTKTADDIWAESARAALASLPNG